MRTHELSIEKNGNNQATRRARQNIGKAIARHRKYDGQLQTGTGKVAKKRGKAGNKTRLKENEGKFPLLLTVSMDLPFHD